MLFSLQTGFSFVRAAVARKFLEILSGFEPSSDVLEVCYSTQFLPVYFDHNRP